MGTLTRPLHPRDDEWKVLPKSHAIELTQIAAMPHTAVSPTAQLKSKMVCFFAPLNILRSKSKTEILVRYIAHRSITQDVRNSCKSVRR